MGVRGFDFREKLVHDLEQQGLGAVEHADVVEGASAAEVGARDGDVEAGGFEDFGGGFGGRGQEVIVEGVGPEEDRLLMPVGRPIQGVEGRQLRAFPTIV